MALTERAHLAMLFARAEAREQGVPQVTTAHVLAGLLREDEGLGAELLTNHGVRLEDVRRLAEPPGAPPPGEDPPLSRTAERVVERAVQEARWVGLDHAATEHLLLGLAHEAGGGLIRLLLDAGLGEGAVRDEVARRRRSGPSWL